MVKALIRRCVGEQVIALYHFVLSFVGAIWFGFPSKKMRVIGVTGTNGKSSTTQLIGQLLELMGERAGWTTTASIKIGDQEWVNDQKMTMLGRLQTHALLRRMVNAGCTYAIVETSSQGLKQNRHVGIAYDVALLTNLTPEHIEAHGGFELYKQAKGILFSTLARLPMKKIHGKEIHKWAIVNAMDPHASYFLEKARGVAHTGFVLEGREQSVAESLPILKADQVMYGVDQTTFYLDGMFCEIPFIGTFYLENVLAAIACVRTFGFSLERIIQVLPRLTPIAGRLERISLGQPFGVIVDYAYEPFALRALYKTLDLIPRKRIIHVVGSAGGGRDIARRKEIGALCAKQDDVVFVTNEDPYDDDPMEIINTIADEAILHGLCEHVSLHRVPDRGQAIEQALQTAQAGDLVIITGKGSEPVMAVAKGRKVPWDDRVAVKTVLKTLYGNSQIS